MACKSSGMQLIAQNKPHEIAWVDNYDDVPVFSVTNNVNILSLIIEIQEMSLICLRLVLIQFGTWARETWGLKLKNSARVGMPLEDLVHGRICFLAMEQ